MTLRRISITALLPVLFLLFIPLPSHAADCPSSGDQEAGGTHRCFDADAKGHVHTWTPGHFDASSAVTVIYVHGYSIDESGSARRQAHYIDRAWDRHGLANQFASSGLNALFIAPEGPVANIGEHGETTGVRWNSLDALLSSVASNAAVSPPRHVVAIGHSAGMFTIQKWVGSSDLKHVVSLDSMYGTVPNSLATYLGGNGRLTLAGGNDQNAKMQSFVGEQGDFTTISGYPSSLNDAQRSAARLHFDSTLRHMNLVTGGQVIPLVLKERVQDGSAAGGGGVGAGSEQIPIRTPELNIPIPNVQFSQALQSGQTLSLPFIGEYISGVYTFLVSIVGVVAGVMIVVGGYQYLTAGGDKNRVEQGRKRILNALLGLVLVFGSYLILFIVNPDLVSFEALKLHIVRSEPEVIDGQDIGIPGEGVSTLGFEDVGELGFCIPKARMTSAQAAELCGQGRSAFTQYAPPCIATDEDLQSIDFNNLPGLVNRKRRTQKVRKALLEGGLNSPLARVGRIADSRGWEVAISSSNRSYETQVSLWCGRASSYPDHRQRRRFVAVPGGSKHGAGIAIDVTLRKKGSDRDLTGLSSRTQSQVPARYVEELSRIFFCAGWNRLGTEIWHFEYGTGNIGCRGKYYTGSDACNGPQLTPEQLKPCFDGPPPT